MTDSFGKSTNGMITGMKPIVYAVILCGGSGSRLWPRSRSKHPKHLLKLNGGSTLVQETIKRTGLPKNRIYCVTEVSHAELLRKQASGIPATNIIVEPDRRGTASAIGLAVGHLMTQADPNAVVVSLHADHLIRDDQGFRETMQAWVTAAQALPRIITLGVQPTYPSTGLGYINLGKRLKSFGKFDVFGVDQFIEKPNEVTARGYITSGKYLWNTGLFAAQLAVFDREIGEHLPKLKTQVKRVVLAQREGNSARAKREYLALDTETIDYGVLEKTKNLAVIPASFDWADVGSWADLHDMLERDRDGNVFDGQYVDIDSHNCFIYSPKQLVATVGLNNLVIIATEDAVLICPKDRSQAVKKVVEKLKASGKTKYL